MSYDAGREDEKLESRVLREMDRRFSGVEKEIAEVERQLQELDEKIETNFKEIARNKRENYIWLLRVVATAIISTVVGAGALGFVELAARGFHP